MGSDENYAAIGTRLHEEFERLFGVHPNENVIIGRNAALPRDNSEVLAALITEAAQHQARAITYAAEGHARAIVRAAEIQADATERLTQAVMAVVELHGRLLAKAIEDHDAG